jgi:uncharacterized protein
MVVGIGAIELFIHNSGSLKAKRQVVKSILGKVRSKFDLSIAEVDHHEKWQRCTIGFAVVTNERGHAHTLVQNITAYVDGLHLAEIIDSKMEIINY